MSPISNRTAATAKALTKKASQMRFRSMGGVVGASDCLAVRGILPDRAG
jgi:hypothetical protein